MLVEDGEVGGDHDPLRRNGPPAGPGPAGGQLQHLGVLEDPQGPGDGGGELQGVKPGLPGEAHRPRHGERQGRPIHQLGGKAQLVQGGQLPLQLFPAVQGVDVIVLLGETAVHLPAQGPVFVQGLQVGRQVEAGPLRPEPPEQLVIDQAVLGGELGGHALGGAAADPGRLHQGAVHPRPGQLVGTQQARQSSADNQHVGV